MEKLIGMYVRMQSKLREERGATMVEYGLMLALIAAVAAATVGTLGGLVNNVFQSVVTTLTSAAG